MLLRISVIHSIFSAAKSKGKEGQEVEEENFSSVPFHYAI